MTEQDKYGMEQLAEYLDMRIRYEEETIKEIRNKLPGEVHGYIRHKREECLKELVSGSIRRRSTDEISNLAHTYRLECMQRLVKDYTGFERILLMKAPREEVKAKTEPETMKKKSNGLKI